MLIPIPTDRGRNCSCCHGTQRQEKLHPWLGQTEVAARVRGCRLTPYHRPLDSWRAWGSHWATVTLGERHRDETTKKIHKFTSMPSAFYQKCCQYCSLSIHLIRVMEELQELTLHIPREGTLLLPSKAPRYEGNRHITFNSKQC